MKKFITAGVMFLFLVGAAAGAVTWLCEDDWCYVFPWQQEAMVGNDQIQITMPRPNQIVGSPLFIKGEARGTWYFEASFPVYLYDANGKQLAVMPMQAQGEWMTTEFVPFEGSLTFSTPETATGILVLQKDNPSGLPQFDRSISIPVRFR